GRKLQGQGRRGGLTPAEHCPEDPQPQGRPAPEGVAACSGGVGWHDRRRRLVEVLRHSGLSPASVRAPDPWIGFAGLRFRQPGGSSPPGTWALAPIVPGPLSTPRAQEYSQGRGEGPASARDRPGPRRSPLRSPRPLIRKGPVMSVKVLY